MALRVSAVVASLLPAVLVAVWGLGTSIVRDDQAAAALVAVLASSMCLVALAARSVAALPLAGAAPLGGGRSSVGIVATTLALITAVSVLLTPEASGVAPVVVALVVLGLGVRWADGRRRRRGMAEVASAVTEFCSARREQGDERAELELVRTFDDRTRRSLPWSLAAEIAASPVLSITVIGVWLGVASAPSPVDVGLLVCAPAATTGTARLWGTGVLSPRGGVAARLGLSCGRASTGSVAVVAASVLSGLFAVALMHASVAGSTGPVGVGVLLLGVVACWCFSAGAARVAGVRELGRKLAPALDRVDPGVDCTADDPATPASGGPPTSGVTDPCARMCADAIQVAGAPVHVLRPAVLGATSAALVVLLLLARPGPLPVVCVALAILPRVSRIPTPAAAAVSLMGAGLAVPMAAVTGISSPRSATAVGALTLVLVVALDEVTESVRRRQEQQEAHKRLVGGPSGARRIPPL